MEGVAFYNVVRQNIEEPETVRCMGLFTYTCPAVLDEFTVGFCAEVYARLLGEYRNGLAR